MQECRMWSVQMHCMMVQSSQNQMTFSYCATACNRLHCESGAVVSSNDNTLVKRVVSEDASKLIRKYLEKTVEDDEGTASPARVKGYVIGGKTGTAEKWPRNEGKYLVSFAGFTPTDKPELMIYVVIDEPHVSDHHQLISSWLMILGVQEKTAIHDACRIEHIISEESFQALKKAVYELREQQAVLHGETADQV